MAISHDRKPKANPAVLLQQGGEEAVLFLPGGDDVHVLNAVGLHVWRLMDGTRTVAEIAGAVEEEFEVGAATALADVGSFLEELQNRGMLEPDA